MKSLTLEADRTVSVASTLNDKIDEAKNEYLDKAGFYYDGLAISNGLAAAGQAATDTAFAVSGLDGVSTFFAAGGNAKLVLGSGLANTVLQGADAALSRQFEKEIDSAAFAFQTTTQKQDNALTFQQALDAKQDLLREEQGALAESQELLSARTQAESRKTALLIELQRIDDALLSNTERLRSKYYADPIHFIRSENAILEADSRFREAQRWLFLTQQALQHKWSQRFAIRSEGSEIGDVEKSYDANSVFKMRNASELDDLLTAYVNFNLARTLEFGEPSTTSRYTIISLRDDILSPNPARFNATASKRTDPGVRVDLATGETVPTTEHFLRQLRRSEMADGDGIRLRINTALLDKPGFFSRTSYSTSNGKVNSPGEWRDKIIYVKVNVVSQDHPPGSMPAQLTGGLSYGGLTIFRTPLIPLPGIEDRLTLPSTAEETSLSRLNPETGNLESYSQFLDQPGDFVTAPYRHFVPSNFNFDGETKNIDKLFQASNSQLAQARIAFWNRSLTEIVPSDPSLEDTLGESFQIDDFRELSVAATRWVLFIANEQGNGRTLNIETIDDIEILVRHRADTRQTPPELLNN